MQHDGRSVTLEGNVHSYSVVEVFRNIIYLISGVLIGAIIGFVAANVMVNAPGPNSSEQSAAENTQSEGAPSDKDTAPLSNEEIRQAIGRADLEPGNLKLQKELGTGLLRYATFTGDSSYLDDVTRLLTRVKEKSPRDSDVLTALGDVELFKAQAGDRSRLKSAEAFYQKSLAINDENAMVRANLGLVYLNMDPPALPRARAEFERALKSDPTNERALQGAALASIRSGDSSGAKRFIDVLKSTNPNTDSIRQLETELEKNSNRSNRN